MKLRLLFFTILLSKLLYAQNYISVGSNKYFLGCKIDKEEFSKIPEIKYSKTRGVETFSSSFSLSKFLPKTGDQGQTGTCVSWATSYYTLSILYNIQNKSQIDFSPYFSYNNLKLETDSSCQDGLNIPKALDFLKYKGGIPNSKYLSQCKLNKDTSTENWDEAMNYRIKDYKAIGLDNRIQRIKKSLSLFHPIVIGIETPYSFAATLNGDTWDGIIDNIGGGHALSLIGYDDNKEGGSFEIMNSWGTDWGDKGKIWIKYSDFDKIVQQVYEITGFTQKELSRFRTRNNFEGEIKIIDKEGKTIDQDISLNDLSNYDMIDTSFNVIDTNINIIDTTEILDTIMDLSYIDDQNYFFIDNIKPKLIKYNFEYYGDSFLQKEFKIKISNKDSGYIYLFSFDDYKGVVTPIGKNNNSNIFLNKRKPDIILPETEYFKNIGFGYKNYILLISKEIIDDNYIEQICTKKYESSQEFINFNFENDLVLKSADKFYNSFKLNNDPGKILPILITLNSIQ